MKQRIAIKILTLLLLITATIQGKAQWEYMTPMPTPRALSTASVLDDKIYVIGGTFHKDSSATSIVEVYDPSTNTWNTDVADLPVPICSAASCVLDGKIYVIGGEPIYDADAWFKSVFEYDPIENTWSSIKDLPSPRRYLTASVVDDKIYVIGGAFDSTLLMYDPVINNWILKENMEYPRGLLSSELVGGKIYAIGGMLYGIARAEVQEYDPYDNTWTPKENMPGNKFWHGSGVINGKIYVFGGADENNENSLGVWKYNLQNDEWLDLEIDLPEVSAAFAYGVSNSNGDQCLYTFGGGYGDFLTGGAGPFVSDVVLKYCPVITSIQNNEKTIAPVALFQNYPNPFDFHTMIKYQLRNSDKVSIKVFNLAGQEVATLVDGFQQACEHEIEWNAEGLSGGVYFYTLQTDKITVTKRVVLQR